MWRREDNFPQVTVHYAQSLDGRIATHTGDSQWFSGQESLVFAHKLRSEHDAILVGVGTVLTDNPHLTTRLVEGRSPLRVVLDSQLRTPATSNVLAHQPERTVIATSHRAASDSAERVTGLGARVVRVEGSAECGLDLTRLLASLQEMGVRSLLVEGGGAVITSFLRERLVQRLVMCIAPKIVGHGIDAIGDLGVKRLSDALTFSSSKFTVLGQDAIFDGVIEWQL